MKSIILLSATLFAYAALAADSAPTTNVISWSGVATNNEGKVLAKITVDTSEAPDLDDWGRRAGELCVQWYPKIIALLPSEGYTPRDSVRLRFRKEYRGVAATSGSTISISANFVRKNTNDWGMVVHELTHVVQSYGSPEPGAVKPGWLVEGIADYIRLTHFEPQARRPRINPDKASYKDAYKTTAIFLEWAAKTKDKDLVTHLSAALRQKKFKLEMFKERTGKTVDELWQEFIETLRPKEEKTGSAG